MSIQFSCLNCGTVVRAPDTAGDKKVRCPHCQAVQMVPAASRQVLGRAPTAKRKVNYTPYIVAAIAVVGLLAIGFGVYVILQRTASRNGVQQADMDEQRASSTSPAIVIPAAGPGSAPAVAPAAGRSPATVPASSVAVAPAALPAPGTAPSPAGSAAAPEIRPVASPGPAIVAPGGAYNPMSYLEVVIEAKRFAARKMSEVRLKEIKKAVDIYAMQEEEHFPASLDELVKKNIMPADMAKTPGNTARTYVYITGLGVSSPKESILVYDPCQYGPDRVLALRVSGDVVELTPDGLRAALKNQKAKDSEIPK